MLRAGTSGYSYAPWKGRFYPPRLPAGEMLAFYARHFETVEINSSFYRVPAVATLEKWAGQVPASFRFAFKAPRRLTHDHQLQDSEGAVAFLQALAGLGERRGPVLFQLPPRFTVDLSRLDAFLAALPRDVPVAFEFRHPSWFDEAVFERLRAHGAALCLAQTESLVTPWVAPPILVTCACAACNIATQSSTRCSHAWQRRSGARPTSFSSTRTRRVVRSLPRACSPWQREGTSRDPEASFLALLALCRF